jgi:hypothetical protein
MWGWLTLILLVAVATTFFLGARERAKAVDEAARRAELTAQTDLAPMLMPADLMAPIVGERAAELTDAIERTIVGTGNADRVRIYSDIGRILYAADPAIVGSRPSYVREVAFEVANRGTRSEIRDGYLHTYVPIWLRPEGRVAVAEISQASAPIQAQAGGSWTTLALAFGAAASVTLAMTFVTSARRPAERSLGSEPLVPAKRPKDLVPPPPDAPMYQLPGFRALEEQRQAAEARALAAEENYRSVKEQLRATLGQLKELEGRFAMQESQLTTARTDLAALRDQLRETSERLHKAELDNNALRERMALRQREIEQARHEVASIRADAAGGEELARRLEEAEARAAELAMEAERLERELDHTRSKLHMTRLSEALRDLGEDIEIQVTPDDEDDLFEHPVVIRGAGRDITTALGKDR